MIRWLRRHRVKYWQACRFKHEERARKYVRLLELDRWLLINGYKSRINTRLIRAKLRESSQLATHYDQKIMLMIKGQDQ